MRSNTYSPFLLIAGMLINSCLPKADERSPLEIAQSVADRIIRETQFELHLVRQHPVLGVQVLNFSRLLGNIPENAAYARSKISSDSDTTSLIGISCMGPTRIWLNGSEIFKQVDIRDTDVKERSYNRFSFNDTIMIHLRRGDNPILIKSITFGNKGIVYLRLITPEGDENKSAQFSLDKSISGIQYTNWLFAGPFSSDKKSDAKGLLYEEFAPEILIENYYKQHNHVITWQPAVPHTLLAHTIAQDNIYQRDSFLEWHYATGAMMWSILKLADLTDTGRYKKYVNAYCDYTMQNYNLFQWQYQQLNAFRGSNHRLFRKTMLDDTGAPSLPFIVLSHLHKDSPYIALVEEMSDYILNEQIRLPDSTFCRAEPEPMTVWADDLFMSVPFLLETGRLKGEEKYFNQAISQIINFYHYLYKNETGLTAHGWFNRRQQNSPVFWGRANGWMIWALSEALVVIPDNYADYQELLGLYHAHISGIISFQDKNGMWHQVLDHPESFEETSSTAMFCLAIARGVRKGWLSPDMAVHALKAWNALKHKINQSGVVSGICRGTGIGSNLEFYFSRKTFDQDPRGLGAVITAGIEVERLLEEKNME